MTVLVEGNIIAYLITLNKGHSWDRFKKLDKWIQESLICIFTILL